LVLANSQAAEKDGMMVTESNETIRSRNRWTEGLFGDNYE
jgi:hypothetical protein